MKNGFLRYLGILAVAAVIFLLGIFADRNLLREPASLPGSASIMVDYGNGKIDVFKGLETGKEEKIIDMLKKTPLDIEYKEYGGDLGSFVVSINGIGRDPAGTKWWQYWINNEYAQAGISSVKADSGDIIEFKFTEGQR